MGNKNDVQILSAAQYFEKYGKQGIGGGADRWAVKRQLIDAFRKEMFDLVAIRTGKNLKDIAPEGDEEASKTAKKVIHDTVMKWRKVCAMFAQFKETANLIELKDLKLYDEIEENGKTSEEAMEEAEARMKEEEKEAKALEDLREDVIGLAEDTEVVSQGTDGEEEEDGPDPTEITDLDIPDEE
jgi:hypothetical protein